MRHASTESRGYCGFRGYWGYFSQALEITRLRRRRKTGRRGRRGFIPDPENIPRNIPTRGLQKVPQFQGLTKNIPNIPNIPGVSGMRKDACIHKETLNFTLLIYIYMRKPNPRHPNMRGDFGDIGDIFRKPSNHAVLPVFEFGDILGMSPRDGDSHAQDTLRVLCTGRFDAIDESAQNCHSEAHSMGRTSGNRGKCPARVLRARYHCVCAAPVDSMASGNPYRQRSELNRSSDL